MEEFLNLNTELFSFLFTVLKNWWWLIFPLAIFPHVRALYLWWIRWCVWYKKNKWIMLEIKPPREILKPYRAMEDIFSIFWGFIDGPNWREIWCEGEHVKGPYWFSLEIVSIRGEVHYYMRILDIWRNTVESTIYSQYPEAEISVVDDYVKNVPQNVPNKDWDLYGEDFSFIKENAYPIKTYPQFFEEKPEVTKEEKRLDPMDSLLEALSKLKSGEQLWLQIVCAPITNGDIPWQTEGRKIADVLAKRESGEKAPEKSVFHEAAQILITGKAGEEPPKKDEGLIAPELRLTPGEKNILQGVETKISKQGFKTWIRVVYLYEKNKPHFRGHYKIARSYFGQFMTDHLNTIIFWGPTRTRIHYLFRDRRLFLRKRMQFKRYVQRLPSTFPWSMEGKTAPFQPTRFLSKGPGRDGVIILNAEELATIYHFPALVKIPTLAYVEAKKGGPPSGLPMEEEGDLPPGLTGE